MEAKVVNVRYAAKYVYIGRPSKWGNPFVIGRDGTREDVLDKYEKYALELGLDKDARVELRGETLGCFCKPKACHGDILVRWANGG